MQQLLKTIPFKLLSILIGIILTGCATTQMVPKPAAQSVSKGKVRISVTRTTSLGGSVNTLVIKDNGVTMGEMGTGGTLEWERNPGPVSLSATEGLFGVSRGSTQFNAKANQHYSFMIDFSSGFEPVQETGKALMEDAGVSQDSTVSQVADFSSSSDSLVDALAMLAPAKEDSRKWLFVVGIEHYQYTDNIAYAKRSAKLFAETVQKVLGVPQQNRYIMMDSGATQAEIKTNLKKMLRRVKSDDTIYFYYNGHGVPVPGMGNAPFMMASNTEPDFIQDETFFSLQNIYTQLSDSKADKVIAIVDSCFSGMTDGKAVIKGVAATRVVPKKTTFDQSKMVVISAGKSHQYSNGYDEKGYRLFSYYIIKNIIDGERNIKSLFKKTKEQTYQTSMEQYGDLRVQEPTIDGNSRMGL